MDPPASLTPPSRHWSACVRTSRLGSGGPPCAPQTTTGQSGPATGVPKPDSSGAAADRQKVSQTLVFRGFGTVVNVSAVLVGSGIGVLVGHRLPQRTRDVVTDALGLVTLLVAALSAFAVTDPVLSDAVGDSAPVLIVLGSLLIGGIAGSLLRIEYRLEGVGGWLQRRLVRADASDERRRFIEGFVAASLLFCIGPLTMLGSLSDGLGNGADQLILKATLDGFAAIAFAASFGWGVAASAVVVGVVQGR